MEVYKQSKGFATQFEVRKELGLMDWRDGLDRLDFCYHQIFDHEVHAEAQIQLNATIHRWKADLG
jgi:hypothetical protein